MGWAGKIRVDNVTYAWLGGGRGPNFSIVTNVLITPTRSIYVMEAGPMNVTVTFLSPIEAGTQTNIRISDSLLTCYANSLQTL